MISVVIPCGAGNLARSRFSKRLMLASAMFLRRTILAEPGGPVFLESALPLWLVPVCLLHPERLDAALTFRSLVSRRQRSIVVMHDLLFRDQLGQELLCIPAVVPCEKLSHLPHRQITLKVDHDVLSEVLDEAIHGA